MHEVAERLGFAAPWQKGLEAPRFQPLRAREVRRAAEREAAFEQAAAGKGDGEEAAAVADDDDAAMADVDAV